jgi:hypothetical protein
MTSLLAKRPSVQSRKPETAPCSLPRSLADLVKHTTDVAYSDPVQWVYLQIQYHERYHDECSKVCAVALADLWCTLRGRPVVSVADLTAHPERIYRGLERLTLHFPRKVRRSALADQLDEQALCYSGMGSPVARLAALVVLWHSEGAEHHVAATADEYFERDEEHYWGTTGSALKTSHVADSAVNTLGHLDTQDV